MTWSTKCMTVSFLLSFLLMCIASPTVAQTNDTTIIDVTRNLRISIQAFSGSIGEEVTVEGTGANVKSPVILSFSSQPHTSEAAFVTQSVTPNSDGSFTGSLVVPNEMSSGRYYIRGEQFDSDGTVLQYYYNEFVVNPTTEAALLPVTGTVPGTSLTITTTLALLIILAMGYFGWNSIKTSPHVISQQNPQQKSS